MLSSTSLLHGNCVFNRNNTVATQQGMKTYWLCKSYRICMCRARCITHQGRVISATGVHNHTPHMRGNNATQFSGGTSNVVSGTTPISSLPSVVETGNIINSSSGSGSGSLSAPPISQQHNTSSGLLAQSVSGGNSRLSTGGNIFQQPAQPSPITTLATTHQHLQHHLPNLLIQQHHHHQQQQQQQQSQQQHLHQNQQTDHHTQQLQQQQHQQQHLQTHLHHPHHHHHSLTAAQNSVIQNIMHLPNLSMLPPATTSSNHQQQQQQHHSPQLNEHHARNVNNVLEITPLMQSNAVQCNQQQQLQQQQQHHQHHHQHMQSPIGIDATTKSPSIASTNDSTTPVTHSTNLQQHMSTTNELLAEHEALSPNLEDDMNTANTTTVRSNENELNSNNDQSHHQAHVIDSITISPGTRHNFKIEDI